MTQLTLTFLVDTCAAVSVLPPSPADRKHPQLHLQAANGSHIPTFGRKSLTPNLGLRRSFPWIFGIAEVSKPILGADFLHHFHLSVDLNKRTLVDNTTQLTIAGVLASLPSLKPSIPHPPNEFTPLLAEYPQLTQPHNYSTWSLRNQVTGGPVEILNQAKVPDKYPIPHLHDFSLPLQGATVFSKLIWSEHITKYQWQKLTFPKWSLPPPLGYTSLSGCPLASGMPPNLSKIYG